FSVVEGSGRKLVLADLGTDARFGLAPNDWVELVYPETTPWMPTALARVVKVDPETSSVTLRGATVDADAIEAGGVLLRRWDQRSTNDEGLVEAPIGGS